MSPPVTPKKKHNSTTKSLWERLFCCCSPKKAEKAEARNMASPPARSNQATEMKERQRDNTPLNIDDTPTLHADPVSIEQTLFCNLAFISLSNFLKNPLLAKILMMTLTQNGSGSHHRSMPRSLMEALTISDETPNYHENPNIPNTLIHKRKTNNNNALIVITAALNFRCPKAIIKNLGTLHITYELITTPEGTVQVEIKQATLLKYRLSKEYKHKFLTDSDLSAEIKILLDNPPQPQEMTQLSDAQIKFHNLQWKKVINNLIQKEPSPHMIYQDFGRPLIGIAQEVPNSTEVKTSSIINFIEEDNKKLLENAGVSIEDLFSNKPINPEALERAETAIKEKIEEIKALPNYTTPKASERQQHLCY